MNLAAYLQRIRYDRPVKVDLETLVGIHRAHLLNITYENLDIHLGKTLTIIPEFIYEKIITEQRGGWCYEMNGLLEWALREIGFSVKLLAGTVGRQNQGNTVEGNHLILLVELDQLYLADVGFGNGFLEPLPLKVGTYQQDFLSYRLDYEGGHWLFENHVYGGPGFDFTLEPHDLLDFWATSSILQTSPESGFVRTTVCHRHTPEGIISLRGAILKRITEQGATEQVIEDLETYRRVLENQFDLRLDHISALWQKVWARHIEWEKQQK